ncbi:TPA: tetratricopeptide repeat protein [Candidatus Poribacteria bacterium]|nr:tetratricopeptide repeat protein [Candidatus Poribacteria bacterium]
MEDHEGLSQIGVRPEDAKRISLSMREGKGAEKQVTIIFAKIGGFKRETSSHDELEEIALRKSQLDNELDSIVSKYGGVVDKVIREFFMATFGTRMQHSDDPARAILAAMEIVETAKKFGVEAHIGINSGKAWVGTIGTEVDTDNTVIGDTVNLAARLKDQAKNNQIIVSPYTYERSKEYFIFNPLPPVRVKGVSESVPIYEVVGKTEKAELIEVLAEDENERLARIQESIPTYLRDKILNSKSKIEGERKPVTMLYSDLSGFTALSERFRDRPDIIAAVIDRCHKELGKIVYKWEGVVDKLVGDEIMAIFGAPVVHEDDPERAITAGLEMMERIKELSRELSKEFGTPPLNIHIGINTGRVSIGNISAEAGLKMDYTVIGEPVELAEKLEDISEPGELIVGESTYRLTRALFDFEPPREIEVAGRKVMVYKVIGRKEKPESKRGVKELKPTEMIGRDEEFNLLIEAAERLKRPERQMVCLIGQAGLGKSRLKREFRAAISDRINWIESACLPHTQRIGYSLFMSLLRRYFGIREDEEDSSAVSKIKAKLNDLFSNHPERVSEMAPFIAHLLSIRSEEFSQVIGYFDPEQLRDRIFMSIRDLLVAESMRKPLVVALDDLHWIDTLSLDLILFMMETIPHEVPLMLLCIYRPERTDPCWEIGEAAAKKIPEAYTEVFLHKLSPDDSRSLLDSLIDLEDGDQLKEMILERADGNPFYMEEVLRSLIDEGILVRTDGGWTIRGRVEEIKVPGSLEQVINARIDKLDDNPKYVLRKSSVIGREFEYVILSRFASDVPRLEDHLNELCALDMIHPSHERRYVFGHIVTYDITYTSITALDRRRYHGEVGECIEELYRDSIERFYGILAHHYGRSDRHPKAIVYLTLAGHQARMLYDNQNALSFYKAGLERFEKLEDKEAEEYQRYRDEIHEGLGDVLQILGEYNEAIGYYLKRLETATSPPLRASIKRRIGLVYKKKGEWNRAMECFQQALDELKAEMDEVEEARIYNAIGELHFSRGDFPRAMETFSRVIELVEGTENYDVLSNAYRYLGNCYQRLGQLDKSLEFYQSGMRIAERINDIMHLSQYYNNLGILYSAIGKLDEAVEYLLKSYREKEKIGYADGLLVTLQNLAVVHQNKGDIDGAIRYVIQAGQIAERAGAEKRAADAYIAIGALISLKGRYDEAIEHYKKAAEVFERIGARPELGQSYGNIADAYIQKNDLENGERYSMLALEIADELNQPDLKFLAFDNLGSINWKRQKFERALQLYRKGLEAIGEESIHSAQLYLHIAQTLICLGRIKEARETLAKAKELCERQGRRDKNLSKIESTAEVLEEFTVETISPELCFGTMIDFKIPQCRDCLNPGKRKGALS